MNIPEEILNTLTDEQKKKVKAAKTPEELLAIAKETGYELTAEQLEAVYGRKRLHMALLSGKMRPVLYLI